MNTTLSSNVRRAILFLRTIGIVGLIPFLVTLYTLVVFGILSDASQKMTAPDLLRGVLGLLSLSIFGVIPFIAAWGLNHQKAWARIAALITALGFTYSGITSIIKALFTQANHTTLVISIIFGLLLCLPGIIILFLLRKKEDQPNVNV